MTYSNTVSYSQTSSAEDAVRRVNNMEQARIDSLPYMKTFCEHYNIKLEETEGKPIDFKGVDYILTFEGKEPLNCSFRLIRGSSKVFHIRHCGHDGGIGEAQKILSGKNISSVYITLELPTRTLRIYKMADVKEWLSAPGRSIYTGSDRSKFYSIPFSDLKPIRQFLVLPSKKFVKSL